MWGIDEKCLKCSHEPSPPFTLREQVKQGTLKRYKRQHSKAKFTVKGAQDKNQTPHLRLPHNERFLFLYSLPDCQFKTTEECFAIKAGLTSRVCTRITSEEREKRSACVYTHQSAPVIPVKALQLLSVWVSPYRNVLYKVKHHPLVRGENSSLGCHSTDKRANTSLNM